MLYQNFVRNNYVLLINLKFENYCFKNSNIVWKFLNKIIINFDSLIIVKLFRRIIKNVLEERYF